LLKNYAEIKVKKYVKKILLFALPALVCALFAFPLQKAIRDKLLETRDSFLETLEKKFNKTILYGGANPSIFGTIDIYDVKVLNAGGETNALVNEQDVFFSVKRMRLKYSLRELLAGNLAGAVLAVTLEMPEINLSLGENGFEELLNNNTNQNNTNHEEQNRYASGETSGLFESFDSFASAMRETKQILDLFPEGFSLRVNDGALNIRAKGDSPSSVSITHFTLNASVANEVMFFRSDLQAEANLVLPNTAQERSFYVFIPVSAEARLDFKTSAGTFNIDLPELTTEYFSLYRTKFLIVWTDDYIELRKTGDRRPYDLSVMLNFNKNENRLLSINASADGFSFDDIIRFKGAFAKYNRWLGTKVKGKGGFVLYKDKQLAYNADFSGSLARSVQLGNGLFDINLYGDEKSAVFKDARLSLARGTVSYKGNILFRPAGQGVTPAPLGTMLPNGVLEFDNFCFTKEGNPENSSPLNAVFNISSTGQRINVFANTVNFGGTRLDGLGIDAIRNSKQTLISFSALRFNNVESYGDVSIAHITADATLDNSNNTLDINSQLDSLALIDILNIIHSVNEFPMNNALLTGIVSNTAITTEISLHTDFKTLRYKIPRFLIAYSGFTEIIALASVSGTDKTFALEDCHIAAGGGIDLKANADYTNPQNVKFDLESVINTVPYTFNGSFIKNRDLNITGSYNFYASALFEKDGTMKGNLKMDSFTLPMPTRTGLLSADASFALLSKDDWSVNLNNLVLISTMFEERKIAQISGVINQNGADFPGILLDGANDPLNGSAKVAFTDSGSGNFAPYLTFGINNRSGEEELAMYGNKQGDIFDLHIMASDFKLYRLSFLNSFPFTTTQSFSVSGQFDLNTAEDNSLAATFDVDMLKGRIGGNDLFAVAHGAVTKNKLEVSNTSVQYTNYVLDIPNVALDREQGTLLASASFKNDTDDLYADVNIESTFENTDSWNDFSKALRDFSGKVSISNAYFFSSKTQKKKNKTAMPTGNFSLDFSSVYSKKSRTISVSGGPQNMLSSFFKIDDSGGAYFYLSLANPSCLRGTVSGDLSNDSIDIRAQNIYLDMETLGRIIPKNFIIQCKDGFAYADIHITGSREDPSVSGIIQGYNVVLCIPDYIGGDIGPAPITARFEDNQLIFDPILARAGNGLGYITMAYELENGIPRSYEINIKAEEEMPLPFSVDISGIAAKGLVWGDINLVQEDDNLTVTGDLTGSNTTINLNLSHAGAANSGDTSVQTNLTIHTGKKVEFLYPNDQYPILRSNIDMGDTLVIKSNSITGAVSLDGDIGIKAGEIYWFQRNFYIREGEIIFSPNDTKLDPRLTMYADSRDQTTEGPVTLTIRIDNQPISQLNPIIEADQALTQVQLYTLLGSSFSGSTQPVDLKTSSNVSEQSGGGSLAAATNTDVNANFVRGFVVSTTDFLANFQLYRRVQNLLRDFFHVDMFSARTQLLQNSIILNIPYLYPEEEAPRLGAYFDNTSVFAGKYITKNLYAELMLSTVYNNKQSSLGGVSLEGTLSVELNSPFFNTRWELNPQDLDSLRNTLWVEDMSITVSKTWHLP